MRDPIQFLQRRLVVRSAVDVFPLLKAYRKLDVVGSVNVLFLRSGGRFLDSITVTDGGDRVRNVVRMLLELDDPNVDAIVVSTDRTGETPADRPTDEADWIALHAIAAEHNVSLLDWFVVWGDKAFSVAELAPIPAGWAA